MMNEINGPCGWQFYLAAREHDPEFPLYTDDARGSCWADMVDILEDDPVRLRGRMGDMALSGVQHSGVREKPR